MKFLTGAESPSARDRVTDLEIRAKLNVTDSQLYWKRQHTISPHCQKIYLQIVQQVDHWNLHEVLYIRNSCKEGSWQGWI